MTTSTATQTLRNSDAVNIAAGLVNVFMGNEDGAYASFPVDTVKIANAYGVEVTTVTFPDKATVSVLVKDNADINPKMMFAKRLRNRKEIRYMTALNLGRVIENQDKDRYGFYSTKFGLSGVERSDFAATFATNLLMPADVMRIMYASGASIRKIARTFGVSKTQVFIRLAQLGLA